LIIVESADRAFFIWPNDQGNRAADHQEHARIINNLSNSLTVESREIEPLRLTALLCTLFVRCIPASAIEPFAYSDEF
jgi:hypothetical protein